MKAADEPYWALAEKLFGAELAHVYVLHPTRQMRVQLLDGTRMLLNERGEQIGRTLPPLR
jgi:hypothetical protein